MGAQKVRVVTDSTADLGEAFLQQSGITMVPLNVHFGDEVYKDYVDLPPDAFYQKLVSSAIHPRTSQPAPGDFMQAYQQLAAEGAEAIVPVHISRHMSGTHQSAQVAAASMSDLDIAIVDTESASLGIGFAALAAAKVAAAGGTKAEVVAKAEEVSRRLRIYFVVDTLKYLERNGRIGKASAFLGTLLNVKPVLKIHEGIVTPVERIRGKERALGRSVDLIAAAFADQDPKEVTVGIIHGQAASEAEYVKGLLETKGFTVSHINILGAVIGTHAGPGTIGIVAY